MSDLDAARAGWTSGHPLRKKDRRRARAVVVVAVGLSTERLARVAAEVAAMQETDRAFKPIFLVGKVDTAILSSHGFLMETVVSREQWVRFGADGPYSRYIGRRVSSMKALYRASSVLLIGPDDTLPDWALS